MIDEQAQSQLIKDDYFINILDDMSFRYKELQTRYKTRRKELRTLHEIVEGEIQKLEN